MLKNHAISLPSAQISENAIQIHGFFISFQQMHKKHEYGPYHLEFNETQNIMRNLQNKIAVTCSTRTRHTDIKNPNKNKQTCHMHVTIAHVFPKTSPARVRVPSTPKARTYLKITPSQCVRSK